MDGQLWWGFLLSFLPGTELRFGLPLVVHWALENGVSYWPYFVIVILINMLTIPVVFLFMDFLHHHLMEWKLYHKTFGRFVEKKRKTADKVQERMHNIGYVALALFVAIPFTGTGSYTGTIIAWILGLDKRKTFVAISVGVLIAGLITLFATLIALGLLS